MSGDLIPWHLSLQVIVFAPLFVFVFDSQGGHPSKRECGRGRKAHHHPLDPRGLLRRLSHDHGNHAERGQWDQGVSRRLPKCVCKTAEHVCMHLHTEINLNIHMAVILSFNLTTHLLISPWSPVRPLTTSYDTPDTKANTWRQLSIKKTGQHAFAGTNKSILILKRHALLACACLQVNTSSS